MFPRQLKAYIGQLGIISVANVFIESLGIFITTVFFMKMTTFQYFYHIRYVQSATKAVSPLVPFCDTLYPQAWEFQVEKCLTSIEKCMQKRHTPRILESMNDMDLLSHNDMREATLLLLLAVQA